MIRLSEILNEQSKNTIDDLIYLLKTDDWIFRKPLIFRGSSTDIETFEVRGARESRTPRDTDEKTTNLVNCVHDVVLSEKTPHRTKATFGTATENDARNYGPNVYILIPHRNAKIAYTEHDPWWEYFRKAKKHVRGVDSFQISNEIDASKSKLHEQVEFLGYAMQMALRGDCSELDYYKSQYGSPFNHVKDLFQRVSDEFEDNEINNFLAYLRSLVFSISQYVNDLTLGYPPSRDSFYEASVEGDYIYLRKDFFDIEKNRRKITQYLQSK